MLLLGGMLCPFHCMRVPFCLGKPLAWLRSCTTLQENLLLMIYTISTSPVKLTSELDGTMTRQEGEVKIWIQLYCSTKSYRQGDVDVLQDWIRYSDIFSRLYQRRQWFVEVRTCRLFQGWRFLHVQSFPRTTSHAGGLET